MFGFLLSADFPKKIHSLIEFSNKYHIRVSNNFDPDQVKHFSVLIWVQTVFKGYQQMILAGKE